MKTLNNAIGDLVKGLKIGSKDIYKDGGPKSSTASVGGGHNTTLILQSSPDGARKALQHDIVKRIQSQKFEENSLTVDTLDFSTGYDNVSISYRWIERDRKVTIGYVGEQRRVLVITKNGIKSDGIVIGPWIKRA
jgi:hypothetical protein